MIRFAVISSNSKGDAMKKFTTLLGIIVVLLSANCILDSKDKKEKEFAPYDSKTLAINYTTLKLIENEEVNFRVTIQPTPEPTEWLVWRFLGPDTLTIIQPALAVNNYYQLTFREGEYILSLAIYDSLEFKIEDFDARKHGSLEFPFAVRKITVEIDAVADQPSQKIIFTANSPQQAWLNDEVYFWDFGDGDTLTVHDSTTVTHQYAIGGEYIVVVNIKSFMYEDDNHRYTVATDTLTITVTPDLSKELTIVLSPQDTTWNTAAGLTMRVESNLTYDDYRDMVKWVADWGDGGVEEFEYYAIDRTVSHRYYNNGNYTLYVKVYHPDTNELLAQDSAIIHISSLPYITQSNYLKAYVKGYTVQHSGTLDPGGAFTETSDWSELWGFGSDTYTLTWDGQSFSAIYQSVLGTQTTVRTFSGEVSGDGETVMRLEYVNDFIDTNYQNSGKVWTRLSRLVLENVPLTIGYVYRYYNYNKGHEIGIYVTEFEDWSKMLNPANGTTDYSYYDQFDWQNTTKGTPEITLELKKIE
jgi:hypothetical protein